MPLLALGCTRQTSSETSSTQATASATGTTSQVSSQRTFPPDDLGRPVALKGPAQRVIAIGPGAVETFFAMNAQKQLVGRDDYADFPAQAKKVSIAGSFRGPNIEQCVALRPDLVILQGETWDKIRLDEWQGKIGVPVVGLTPVTVDSVAKDIEILGKWLGKESDAERLLAPWNALKAAPQTPSSSRLKAFIETGRSPLWIAGQGTLVSDTVQQGGFVNVTSIKGYQQYNIENLIAQPPDVYIVPSKEPQSRVLAELRADPKLSKLPCIQAGRVIALDGDLLLRPGPRLFLGVQKLRAAAAKLSRKTAQ